MTIYGIIGLSYELLPHESSCHFYFLVSMVFQISRIQEAVAQKCKKMFLKISQNSQENTYARVSLLMKLQAEACNFIKKEILVQVIFC